MNPKYVNYVLSFSFGNSLKNDGGTDKVIHEHQKTLYDSKISYIQIGPINNKLFDDIYSVVIDGEFYKLMSLNQLKIYLNLLNRQMYKINSIFIHHFLNFKISSIKQLINSSKAPIYVYIHDFHLVCQQNNLLRNDIEFCGTERPSSIKCSNCKYGTITLEKIKQFHTLFDEFKNRIVFVSPSGFVMDIIRNEYILSKEQCIVIPHQKFEGEYKKHNVSSDLLRVAFVGKYTEIKGKKLWDRLVETNRNNNIFELYYLGSSNYDSKLVKKVNVDVSKENPNAMIDALRKHNIDIAVLFSIWPETYSYTYYEAMAAGAFVITNCNSGNIALMTKTNGNGKVFDSVDDCITYMFHSDDIKIDIQKWSDDKPTFPGVLLPNDFIRYLLDTKGYEFNSKSSFSYKKLFVFIVDIMYRVKYSKVLREKI